MKKSIGLLFGTLAAAGMLAACNNGNSWSSPGTGTNCGGPPNQLEVLYPKPGAKHVKDTLGNIWVATNGPLPANNQYNLWLKASQPATSQFTSAFSSVKASAVPTPHASPSYSNAQYYASSLQGPPGPANTIIVYWNIYGSGCNANYIISNFTTE